MYNTNARSEAALLAVVNKAIDAESARRRYSDVYRGSNALTSDRRSEALSLRPWGAMAERARLLLISDRYNYLVNGAFEYRGFSWEVTGDGTNVYTTARNHDADDNWMVQCHAGQGISLELPDDDGWHELRFHPADLPAGDHEFVITVKNPGDEPLVVNLDDLNLRLRP